MISSLAWVPAGCAASNPKKYELSRAEQELVDMMQNKGNLDEFYEEEVAKQQQKRKTTIVLPKIDASSLPADLRMDEYSSDEDDNEQKKGFAIGRMLVGTSHGPSDIQDDEEDDDSVDGDDEEAAPRKSRGVKPEDDDDDDDASDDDDVEVPDTREFEALDLEGMQAMGLSQVGTNGGGLMLGEVEDDESELEDVRISADDAMILVAKTEDVSGRFDDLPLDGLTRGANQE
jgi:hypothetical protein